MGGQLFSSIVSEMRGSEFNIPRGRWVHSQLLRSSSSDGVWVFSAKNWNRFQPKGTYSSEREGEIGQGFM